MSKVASVQPVPQPKSEPTHIPDGARAGAFANALATAVGETAGPPAPTRFQQSAFLNAPVDLPLPAFMLSRWQPRTQDTPAQDRFNAVTNTNRLASISSQSSAGPTDRVAGSHTALPLSAFPRPQQDNGRGIHWIPTTSQTPEVIDKYVSEAVEMGIKWVTLLNDGTDTAKNDYLVKKLVGNGIEPVMRVYTDGGAPIEGNIAKMVRHYKAMGVNYFQLYNEPNLRLENGGAAPNPQKFAAKWLEAAREVVKAGGYPGFGSLSPTPGLAPGAAPGDMDDLKFLRESLQAVKALGGDDVLDQSWLSVHNYGHAHLRVRDYDKIVQEVLGRSMPQIGTEAGIYPGDTLSQKDATQIVADAYRYLPQREDYYFAYTYWIIANESGHGQNDAAWNHQALFRPDGRDPLVDILKQEQIV